MNVRTGHRAPGAEPVRPPHASAYAASDSLIIPAVRRIAVLAPGAIGDFVFLLPALHALRAAYPAARIILLGNRWQEDFLRNRPCPVDEVRVLPPFPGIGLPPSEPPSPECEAFLARLRGEGLDIALQCFGGGRYSNPLIRALGARVAIGSAADGAMPLDRTLPVRQHANHRLLLLQLAALAGATPCIPVRELAVTDEDRVLAAVYLQPGDGERIVVVHPGAADPRRRWPADRFAAVADVLAEQGATIVLSAGAEDAPLAAAIRGGMRHRAGVFAEPLSLRALCGILERAAMIVSNDTGPLHLALAIGTPAVGIFWHTNLVASGPLHPELLSPAVSARVHCPVCGAENLRSRCPHDVSFVDDVPLEEVMRLALSLYAES